MPEKSVELDKICDLLDKLTLDTLTLMQQHVETKIKLENTMIEGESNLAKTRYILGQTRVSSLQLPTEDSPEFPPLVTVHTTEDENYSEKHFEMEKQIPNNTTYFDPLKWFGYLTPRNLNLAQISYGKALQWMIESVNIQERLRSICGQLEQIKILKQKIIDNNNSNKITE